MNLTAASRRIAKGIIEFAHRERQANPAFRLTEETLAPAHPALLAEEWPTSPAKKPRAERDALFDGFALAVGVNPSEATSAIKRTIAVALADVLAVSPNADAAEFRARAEAFKKKHKDWALTAPTLAKYWGELGPANGRTTAAKGDVYIEPPDWKSERTRAGLGFSPETWANVCDREWRDISVDLRADILRHAQ
jgi:hypothetical protein